MFLLFIAMLCVFLLLISDFYLFLIIFISPRYCSSKINN